MNSFFAYIYMAMIASSTAIFKEYCTPGLCEFQGGDGVHSGCRDNVLHDSTLRGECDKDAYVIDIDTMHRKIIVDKHNEQRNTVAGGGLKGHGLHAGCRIGAVIWNEELRYTAELHVKSCIFAHDKCRNTLNFPLSGQNIGVTTYSQKKKLNATYQVLNFMNLWYLEYKHVTQAVIDSYVPSSNPMTGHFLTSLNERNSRVGCSAVNFRKNATHLKYMLTCNYASTNLVRGAIYNSCKVPGKGCLSGKDLKYPNLCSTKEEYDVSGMLKLIPYDDSDEAEDDDNIDYGDEDDDADEDYEYQFEKETISGAQYINYPPLIIYGIMILLFFLRTNLC